MLDENRYDDIINLPHHVSPTRSRMSRLNRAAQFSPFAALTGYGDAITEAARLTKYKVDLSEDDRAKINDKLNLIKSLLPDRPSIVIAFFRPDEKKAGGEYISLSGIVKKIRVYERELLMEDGTVIPFDDIMEIDGKIFDVLN